MDYKYFKLEKNAEDKGILLWTICRPPMNALNLDVIEEMGRCLDEIQCDPEVKVIVLTGEGKAFIAGADIDYMYKSDVEKCMELCNKGAALMRRIETMPKIFIAAVNGFCLGGGLETSLACDLRLASTKAKFGLPEVGLGIIPGYGGGIRLPRAIHPAKAKEMIYTGRHIGAQEAYEAGLVLKVVEPDALVGEAIELAKAIRKNSPHAVGCAKLCACKTADVDLETAMLIEASMFRLCAASTDKTEGMGAFMEKRAASFSNEKYQY